VVLVEGFAELVLMPRFAAALGIDLDRLGVTVCAVHGTHFSTYVRFLSALEAPWVVITDGDPERRQTGAQRATALVEALERPDDDPEEVGIFVGATTLERDIYDVSEDNRRRCLEALASERIPQADKNTIGDQLAADTVAMTSGDFLEIVSKAGKGSYAQRLAAHEQPPLPPPHIRLALERITA
jgi:putative ATP-dependent endonuclease of OLD family